MEGRAFDELELGQQLDAASAIADPIDDPWTIRCEWCGMSPGPASMENWVVVGGKYRHTDGTSYTTRHYGHLTCPNRHDALAAVLALDPGLPGQS